MTHFIPLTEKDFNNTDGLLLIKHDPLFATNDTCIISLSAHREQKVRYIKQIVTEKVNKNYCYLLLSEQQGADDVPDMGQPE